MDQPLVASASSTSSRPPPPGMLVNLLLEEGDDEGHSVSSLDAFFSRETESPWSFIFAETEVAVVSSYTVDEVASSLPPPTSASNETFALLGEPAPEVLALLGAPVAVTSEKADDSVVEALESTTPNGEVAGLDDGRLSAIPSTDAETRFTEGAGRPWDPTGTENPNVWYGVWGFAVTLGLATTVYAAFFMR